MVTVIIKVCKSTHDTEILTLLWDRYECVILNSSEQEKMERNNKWYNTEDSNIVFSLNC